MSYAVRVGQRPAIRKLRLLCGPHWNIFVWMRMQQKLQTTFIIHFCLSVTIFALYDFRVRPASGATWARKSCNILSRSQRRSAGCLAPKSKKAKMDKRNEL